MRITEENLSIESDTYHKKTKNIYIITPRILSWDNMFIFESEMGHMCVRRYCDLYPTEHEGERTQLTYILDEPVMANRVRDMLIGSTVRPMTKGEILNAAIDGLASESWIEHMKG